MNKNDTITDNGVSHFREGLNREEFTGIDFVYLTNNFESTVDSLNEAISDSSNPWIEGVVLSFAAIFTWLLNLFTRKYNRRTSLKQLERLFFSQSKVLLSLLDKQGNYLYIVDLNIK
ncbi:MAG: hypothetical protein HRT73_15540 [Flavobacteriales bacterium]|nr:hypothetical protein [Flavobacteriales bacterium]